MFRKIVFPLMSFAIACAVPVMAGAEVIWSAGFEDGTLDEWSARGGGASYSYLNDAPDAPGIGSNTASKEQAHTGHWSGRFSIPAGPSNYPNVAKASLWRWSEPSSNSELYYSVWYFLPQRYEILTKPCCGWLNLFQFHSLKRDGSNRVANGTVLFVKTRSQTGGLQLMLSISPEFVPGGREWLSPLDLPIGQWFNIEVRFRCAANSQGEVQVWQDGIEIFRAEKVTTKLTVDSVCHWGINAYGQYILPSPVVIYVDDVSISTTRIGK